MQKHQVYKATREFRDGMTYHRRKGRNGGKEEERSHGNLRQQHGGRFLCENKRTVADDEAYGRPKRGRIQEEHKTQWRRREFNLEAQEIQRWQMLV